MADAAAPVLLSPADVKRRGLDLRLVQVSHADRAAATASLDAGERARADRFARDEDRARFCLGRGLLREMLGASLERDPATLRFEPDAQGKPRLVDAPPGAPAFNLSHSGDWVMAAIGPVAQIGVDIEAHRPDVASATLARSVFTAAEMRGLEDPEGRLDLAAFFRQWVLKEAVLKAIGTGLATDPRAIEIATDGGSLSAHFPGRTGPEARFAGVIVGIAAPAGYSAALAFVP